MFLGLSSMDYGTKSSNLVKLEAIFALLECRFCSLRIMLLIVMLDLDLDSLIFSLG